MGTANLHSTLHNDANDTLVAIQAVVGYTGDTDTATLTGRMSHAPQVLASHFTDADNSSTTETDLYLDTITLNTLSVNGQSIDAVYGGVTTSHATAKRTINLYLDGTQLFTSGALTTTSAGTWELRVTMVRVDNNTVRSIATFHGKNFSTTQVVQYVSGSVSDLDVTDTVLQLTGTAGGTGAASSQITAKNGRVTWYPVG